eukprot:8009302-Ditylum_brightwellii.AAC.1
MHRRFQTNSDNMIKLNTRKLHQQALGHTAVVAKVTKKDYVKVIIPKELEEPKKPTEKPNIKPNNELKQEKYMNIR